MKYKYTYTLKPTFGRVLLNGIENNGGNGVIHKSVAQ